MADDRLRTLERRWAETNAPDARDAYLNERCRLGLPLVPEEGNVISGVLEGAGPVRPLKGAAFYLPDPGWFRDPDPGAHVIPVMGWVLTVEGGAGHVRLVITWDSASLGVTMTANHPLANSEPVTFRFSASCGAMLRVEGAAAGGRVMRWRVLLERDVEAKGDAQTPAAS